MEALDYHLLCISSKFQKSGSQASKHRECVPHLQAIATDRSLWGSAIKRNMLRPGFASISSPTIDVHFPILITDSFTVALNFFSPSPSLGTGIASTVIHHHEYRTLTSVVIQGGYSSMTFSNEYQISPIDSTVSLKLESEFKHELNSVLFIPPFTPHVVFFPDALTMTVALWSFNLTERQEYENQIKSFQCQRSKVFFESCVPNTAYRIVKDNMFYIKNDKIHYSEFSIVPLNGPSFIQNFFWKLQQLELTDLSFLWLFYTRLPEQEQKKVAPWLHKILTRAPIELSETGYKRYYRGIHPTLEEIHKAIVL